MAVCVACWLISLGFLFAILGISRASDAGPLPLFVVFKTVHCSVWAVPISFLANWTAMCRASAHAQEKLQNERRRRKELLEAGEAPSMGFNRAWGLCSTCLLLLPDICKLVMLTLA